MDVSEAPRLYSFAGFEFVPGRRVLMADGRAVPLSSRAFDILGLLIENRHRVVSREEILATVWRGISVDENNLAVQISALRRALAEHADGTHFILTIPGQGYKFAEPAPPASPLLGHEPAVETPSAGLAPAAPAPRAVIRRKPGLLAAACLAGAALIATGVMVLRRPAAPAGPPRLSIAVLPFRNLSADTQQNYLADAISDDLTTDLSQIPSSFVIARESADAYRDHPVPTQQIGAALNVRYLLEGSLRQEGPALHINAQLIDAATGAHLWASAFDVNHDGLAQARVDIVRHIASVLSFTLVQVEAARSLHERPSDPDAVDLFLQARSILDRTSDMAGLKDAQHLLERALATAPDYSDALAALGSILLHEIRGYDDPDENAHHTTAQTLIAKALASSPQNPAAINANGQLAEMDGRCESASQDYRRALALAPDDIESRQGLIRCARALGNMNEMLSQLKELLAIDPLGPKVAPRESMIGMAYLMLMKPSDAIWWLHQAGAVLPDPDNSDANLGWREWRQIYLIAALQESGERDLAAKAYQTYAAHHPNRTVWHLASYDSRALASLPGHKAYMTALQGAGMPAFAPEDAAAAISRADDDNVHNDFTPTPTTLDGAKGVTTSQMRALLSEQPAPLILDTGRCAAVVPGAICVWQQHRWGDQTEALVKEYSPHDDHGHRSVIVMGDGPFGWRGFLAARGLVAQGVHSVLWYRGGEEAWMAAGNTADDRRNP